MDENRFKLNNLTDSEALIRTKALENGVLALPGTVCHPDARKTAYVRAAFSLLAEEQADEALRRLRDVIVAAQKEAVSASA